MTKAFAQAHLLKRKQKNEELWLEGIYMSKAFGTVLHNAFDKNKEKYFTKPLDIFPKTDAEIEEEIREKRKRLVNYLAEWKKAVDQQKKMGVDQDGKP